MKIPVRPSLVLEVISALREGIVAGGWQGHLPGERQLSRDLQVSRPTLRQALQALEEEGILLTQSRSRRKILRSPKRLNQTHSRIVLLTPQPLERMESSQVAWVEPLRQALSRLGRELQICVHPRAFAQKGIRILEKWIRETPASGWIVLYSTEAMQAWFHQQNLPVIIAGSSFREDRLHSIDLDFRALGRHAAGMLLARGYSRIGLLTRSDPRAGDQLTEQGFQEALATHPESTVESLVIRYDGTPTGFARALDRFSQRASLPSAYLTVDFSTLLSLLTYLMSKNQIMGRDYSVISRDESTFIHSLIPSVAYYRRDQERYGKALLRMLLRVIREPRLRPQSVKMMPSFQTGASILANAKRSPRF